MNLSQGEKLILLALASADDGEEAIDLKFIRSAILSGNTWALSWQFVGVPTEDTNPAVAGEVADILSMWSFIEHSVNALSPDDKAALEKDAYPYNLEFEGFDGNNDAHHSVAAFIIEDMGRFDEFRNRPLNSHSIASLPHYRNMLPRYKAALEASAFGSRSLSPSDILMIVKPE